MPLSDGARDLIARLEESTKPLWVLSWGGTNVLAEALQHIRKLKTPEMEAALHSRLRVYTISDQDDTGDWIRNTFPDVFYMVSIHGFGAFDMAAWQGISHPNSRGNLSVVSSQWLQKNIRLGPLGTVYPESMHIMEGDTPTFLFLIQNGLGSPENPNFGSWGGRYRAVNVGSAHYADVVDTLIDIDGRVRTDQKATICRWRSHYQNDFAARMRWTITSDFREAVHPPVPIVNGQKGPNHMTLSVHSGDTITLDASESFDPDHAEDTSGLEFQWYQYCEPTLNHPIGVEAVPRCQIRPLSEPMETSSTLSHNDAGFQSITVCPRVSVTVPDSRALGIFNLPAQHWLPHTGVDGMCYHIILQVTKKDVEFPLSRYMRIVLDAGIS